MMFTRASLDKLRSLVDPREVLVHFGGIPSTKITDTGTDLRCPCPLHGGDNPSAFSWNKLENIWTCFTRSCGSDSYRDVFSFVSLKSGVSFSKAVELVAAKFNFELTADMEKTDAANQHIKKLVRDRSRVNKFKTETLQKLGYLPGFYEAGADTLLSYLRARGYEDGIVKEFHLYPCLDSYRLLRVGIPVYDNDGILVGINSRLMDKVMEYPEKVIDADGSYKIVPKYKMSKFAKGQVLYNLHKAKHYSGESGLIVVEGQFDVMRLWSYGYQASVATLGTSLSPAQVTLLLGHAVGVCFLIEEGLPAMSGVEKSIKLLPETTKIKVARLPSGDADSNSKDVVDQCLKAALPISMSLHRQIKAGANKLVEVF